MTDITYHRMSETDGEGGFQTARVAQAFGPATRWIELTRSGQTGMSPDAGGAVDRNTGPRPRHGGWRSARVEISASRGRDGYHYADGETAGDVDLARAGKGCTSWRSNGDPVYAQGGIFFQSVEPWRATNGLKRDRRVMRERVAIGSRKSLAGPASCPAVRRTIGDGVAAVAVAIQSRCAASGWLAVRRGWAAMAESTPSAEIAWRKHPKFVVARSGRRKPGRSRCPANGAPVSAAAGPAIRCRDAVSPTESGNRADTDSGMAHLRRLPVTTRGLA